MPPCDWVPSGLLPHPAAGDTNITVYQWDNRNRLVEVDTFGGGVGTVALQREFAYDGNQIVLQFNGAGALTERYLWGPAVDQILAQESPQNAGEVDWALTDNIGTVRDIVATNGSAWTWAEHRIMDAFDQTRATLSNETVDMIFGYTGRPLDDATGLQNNLNRWYDANTGRWLDRDPSRLGPDSNPYRYVGNEVTIGSDPSGLGIIYGQVTGSVVGVGVYSGVKQMSGLATGGVWGLPSAFNATIVSSGITTAPPGVSVIGGVGFSNQTLNDIRNSTSLSKSVTIDCEGVKITLTPSGLEAGVGVGTTPGLPVSAKVVENTVVTVKENSVVNVLNGVPNGTAERWWQDMNTVRFYDGFNQNCYSRQGGIKHAMDTNHQYQGPSTTILGQ